MFHLSTIEKETFSILERIFTIPEIKNRFALAGGTSLALQIGHRHSIDWDIFSPHNLTPTNWKSFKLDAKQSTLN